jgi:two-component system LytT family response regulator
MLGSKTYTTNPKLYYPLKLSLSTIQGFTVIEVPDIIYCRAYNNYTIFHLKENKKICVCKSLTEYEILLEHNDFMRVHKSFLINLHHIKEYRRGEGGVVIMSNKEEIEISRRKKDLFLTKAKAIFKF